MTSQMRRQKRLKLKREQSRLKKPENTNVVDSTDVA
jgi:hypothetical protein